MTVWVDADACPQAVKEILYRAAIKRGVALVLVANTPLRAPESPHIRTVRVGRGFDEADAYIAGEARPGDLAVTADIPLAAKVVEKGGTALNPRGELYTCDNVKACLTMRNLMAELRSGGLVTGGPAPLSRKHLADFANGLDRFLTRALAGG